MWFHKLVPLSVQMHHDFEIPPLEGGVSLLPMMHIVHVGPIPLAGGAGLAEIVLRAQCAGPSRSESRVCYEVT